MEERRYSILKRREEEGSLIRIIKEKNKIDVKHKNVDHEALEQNPCNCEGAN